MKGKQKIIIICVSLGMLLIIAWTIWSAFIQKQPQPIEKIGDSSSSSPDNQDSKTDDSSTDTPIESGTLPSNESITAAIIKQNPNLVNSQTNIPGFTIVNSKEPLPGWYVVTLYNNDVTTSNAVVVMQNVNNNLVIVAGPGTGLTTDKNLPQEVREALY